jgi:hypothetical protein
MPKNHRNRSWRSHWTCERSARVAVHKSGVRARVAPSQTNPANDTINLEGIDALDTTRWEPGLLLEQALKLWQEGAF